MRGNVLLAQAAVAPEPKVNPGLERCHGVAEMRFASRDAGSPNPGVLSHVASLYQATPCRVLFRASRRAIP